MNFGEIDCMNIGDYLKQVIAKRGMSITQLSKELNLKSRNVLYRVFDGYYGLEKTRDLIEQIDDIIKFSDAEKAKFGEFLNKGMVPRHFVESRDVLSNIYNFENHGEFSIEVNGKTLRFSDILEHAASYQTVVVFMSGITDERIIGAIDSFLGQSENSVVYNYLQFSRRSLASHEIVALLTLRKHENYTPLLTNRVNFSGVFILCKKGNDFLAYNLDYFRDHYMFVETPVTEQIFDHIILKKDSFNSSCAQVERPGNKVSNYVEIMNNCAPFEDVVAYLSEGAPCFGSIPYTIVFDMFKDINYFGFPKDHPYVTKLIDTFINRQKGFMENETGQKLFLFDEEPIIHMMKTGLSFDHAGQFKPMKPGQTKKYFDMLIKYAREMPNKMQFRFVKGGIKSPFAYGSGFMLYSYHSESGYMDGSFVALNEKAVLEVMDDFMPYVWDEFTLSNEQSIKKLKELSKTYIKL